MAQEPGFVMKRSRQKSGKQIDQTQAIALSIIIVVVIAIFVIIDNPRALNLGTITGGVATEYKTPVGGTVTISYTIATWNGAVCWYAGCPIWGDMEKYQYNYDVINLDTGRVVARGNSWRLVHPVNDAISLKMNIQGTYRYRLQETIDFFQENRKQNGTAKDFRIIVGNGINPTPTPTPSGGTGGTVTVISEPIDEVTVITTPAPAITFQAYDAGTPTPTPGEIKVTPITTSTSVRTASTPVITPITTQPTVTEDTDLTFVPAAETTPEMKKEIPGFETVLVLISLYVLVRGKK